jgi:hypothetical protein
MNEQRFVYSVNESDCLYLYLCCRPNDPFLVLSMSYQPCNVLLIVFVFLITSNYDEATLIPFSSFALRQL